MPVVLKGAPAALHSPIMGTFVGHRGHTDVGYHYKVRIAKCLLMLHVHVILYDHRLV